MIYQPIQLDIKNRNRSYTIRGCVCRDRASTRRRRRCCCCRRRRRCSGRIYDNNSKHVSTSLIIHRQKKKKKNEYSIIDQFIQPSSVCGRSATLARIVSASVFSIDLSTITDCGDVGVRACEQPQGRTAIIAVSDIVVVVVVVVVVVASKIANLSGTSSRYDTNIIEK
jgi:hypothetical protein